MKGNFNSIINSATPVLVDFFAEWCGPCKTQSPILVDVARELNGKIKVIKIDVDKNPEIAAKYQVRGVPTLALFKNGQSVWRQSGVMDKQNLIYTLKNHI
jgi:thioredoxin 1